MRLSRRPLSTQPTRRAAWGRPDEQNVAHPDLSERLFRVVIAVSLGRMSRRPGETAQTLSIRYGARLDEAGIEPSVGSVGVGGSDGDDCAYGLAA